jgi:hypothetical protein
MSLEDRLLDFDFEQPGVSLGVRFDIEIVIRLESIITSGIKRHACLKLSQRALKPDSIHNLALIGTFSSVRMVSISIEKSNLHRLLLLVLS